jgi:hypothetical protein
MVEGLERRQLMAATPKIVEIKIAKAADTDGTSLNSNRIIISFDRSIRLLDTSKFSSFGYANDMTDITKQVKKRVTLTVTKPEVDENYIQINTDRLVRKGSRLTIALGGLSDTKGNPLVYDASTPAKTITFNKGQNKPRYTLSNRQFVPTDLSYFDRDVFASAPNAPAASTTPATTTIRKRLVSFMNKKVDAGQITKAQANAAIADYFDSSTVAGIMPNANLRAALASLVGTVGEPAIESYIGRSTVTRKSYTSVTFGSVSSSAPVGETKLSPGGRLSLEINPIYAGEPFQVLSATLAHEILHQDASTNSSSGTTPSSQDEEIIANAVETIVYAQQLLIDPSPAGNATALIVRTNTRLLAMLNSGDKLFPYGGILQAPALKNNGNVFVGAKANPGNFGGTGTVRSFENWIRREYVFRGFSAGGTNTNPTAVAILGNIFGTTKVNLTLFGTGVENLLDTQNTILTDTTYVRLASALKLTI